MHHDEGAGPVDFRYIGDNVLHELVKFFGGVKYKNPGAVGQGRLNVVQQENSWTPFSPDLA